MNQPPPSIWLRPERSARGPVPEHSRAEIARAAVTLADEGSLAAVTMRSVAAAIGTGPASLYRYVTTRDEILELMADEAAGEYQFTPPPSQPLAGLLELAHQARQIFRRHPWLLDLPAAGGLPGPNAIDFTEHVLAVLDGTPLTSAARLELVGVFTGLVRLLTRTEADLRRAGQQLAQWQGALAGYLASAVADGRRPHLAAALASALAGASPEPTEVPPAADDPFDQTLTRLLTGLLVS
jgi:AcrR family transcriptional regulator